MSKDITCDKVMEDIHNLKVPYDNGFDTEEWMIASYKAGLLRAARMVGEKGNIGLMELLKEEAIPKDGCESCKGSKGGVRGNENVVNGVVLCDYCTQ